MQKKYFLNKKNSGFAILYVMMIITIAVGISMGVANIVYKERVLSRIGRDSLNARAAADVGMECMLAKDKMPTFFDPTLGSFTLNCGRDSSGNPVSYNATLTSVNPSTPPYLNYKYTVDIGSTVNGPCFVGYLDRDLNTVPAKTNIIVQGYNICDNTNPARVERGISATYDSLAGNGSGGSTCNPGFMCATVTGGTEVVSGSYKIVTFDTPGATSSFDVTQLGSGLVEVLVIGGGGGGGVGQGFPAGTWGGGGGGGGEVVHSLTYNILTLGVIPVTVGQGGLGATTISTNGQSGSNSVFDLIIAGYGGYGGGAGAGGPGANGGGGAFGGAAGGIGTLFNGGAGWPGFTAAGGGAGAGGAGNNASASSQGGNGGVGLFKNITGTLIEYAKGGGGGAGSIFGTPSGNGITYGSGGGGTTANLMPAGNGKDGAVIIKYQFR